MLAPNVAAALDRVLEEVVRDGVGTGVSAAVLSASGHWAGVTTEKDSRQAMEASRDAASQLRTDVTRQGVAKIEDVAEVELVHLQVPELV